MAGVRFLIAGILLYGMMMFQGKAHPSKKQWLTGTLMGVLFLSIGNGALVKALEFIDSGLAALIIAFDPLIIVMFMWGLVGIRPGRRNLFGTFLGIIGMVILIGQPTFISSEENIKGLWLITLSMVSWAFGSIYISRLESPQSKGMGTSIQMIAGGSVLLLYSLITSEYKAFDMHVLTLKGGLSWLYLIIFGSIVAFSSFNYLLHTVSPDKVSTSTLINPIVALSLGWLFNNEHITVQSIIAAVVLLSGVFFINSHKVTQGPKIALEE
jgi:drug/metabolite transporter (DMT)-like permease